MKLVEIAGHLIDPGKVNYVGPLEYDQDASSPRSTAARSDAYSFKICVGGGVTWMCRAYIRSDAKAQRDALIAAIESAENQAELAALEAMRCRFSWPEHDDHSAEDYLTGECWPKHPDPHKSPGDNGAMGASDAPQMIPAGLSVTCPDCGSHLLWTEEHDDPASIRWVGSDFDCHQNMAIARPGMGASEALVGIEMGPEERVIFNANPLMGLEGVPPEEWPNISCADRCISDLWRPTCRDDPGCPKNNEASDALVGVEA